MLNQEAEDAEAQRTGTRNIQDLGAMARDLKDIDRARTEPGCVQGRGGQSCKRMWRSDACNFLKVVSNDDVDETRYSLSEVLRTVRNSTKSWRE